MVLSGRRLVLAVFVLLLVVPARAEEEETSARWERLQAQVVERLHELAKYCASVKLFAARAEVYEDVLHFDPDDEVARKWLRYKRAKDGSWVRPRTYTKPKDRSRNRDSFEERRGELRAWFEAEATPLLEAATDDGDVRLRSRILAGAVRVVPDSEELRLENGETEIEVEGQRVWILEETERSRRRRPELFEAVKLAVENAPEPRTGSPGPADGGNSYGWGRVRIGPHLRVLGTPDAEEMERQYRYCEACFTAFRRAVDPDPTTWAFVQKELTGLSVWVFDDLEKGNEFLSRHPAVTPEFQEFASQVASLVVPGTKGILVKAPDPLIRLEAGPRQVLGIMSYIVFTFSQKRAWAGEALSHYLAYLVTGTHLMSSVALNESRYGGRNKEGSAPPRQMGGDDWRLRGLEVISGEKKPNLHRLAGKDVNDLEVDEVLYAYCIVAYLIEGHAEQCQAFLRAVGTAETADLEPIVIEHLGFDVATLEARVRRWLEETTCEGR